MIKDLLRAESFLCSFRDRIHFFDPPSMLQVQNSIGVHTKRDASPKSSVIFL